MYNGITWGASTNTNVYISPPENIVWLPMEYDLTDMGVVVGFLFHLGTSINSAVIYMLVCDFSENTFIYIYVCIHISVGFIQWRKFARSLDMHIFNYYRPRNIFKNNFLPDSGT